MLEKKFSIVVNRPVCDNGIWYEDECITPVVTISDTSPVTLGSDGTVTDDITIKLTAPSGVALTEGSPLHNVYITIMENGNVVDEGQTNPDGVYSTSILLAATGTYTFDVYVSATKYE